MPGHELERDPFSLKPVSRVRIVVTGMGAVSPFGVGLDALWRGLLAGESAIGPFDLFDASAHRTHIAGQAPVDLDAPAGPRGARLTRSDRFALAAAREAWEAAGLESVDRARMGVFFGSSTGGMLEGERFFREVASRGPGRARASRIAAHPTSGPAEALARAFGIRGPVETVAAACSASTMAIEAALFALRAGEVDVALAGGADALCQLTYGGFNALRAVDERPARPFREDRAGLSLGEGAGVLVLEPAALAARRGASPLAELAGTGSSCDAYHMTAPDPGARGAANAMKRALADAGLREEDVAFVDAHGTGTPHNDASESRALELVFGERARHLPVTATKGAVGHLLGACGALEAVVTVLGLKDARVPPTPGDGPIDPETRIDLVLGAPRALEETRAALSVNFAFGGANAALVFRALPLSEAP